MTLTRHDEWTAGTWIHFRDMGVPEGMKTRVFQVYDSTGTLLGAVRWFGRWRCYAFYPHGETVYEPTCLREIAEFCAEETRRHREAKKARA